MINLIAKKEIFNLNGVKSKKINSKYYVIKNKDGSYESSIKLLAPQIDNICVLYGNLLISRLFSGKEDLYKELEYHYFIRNNNKILTHAGLGAESRFSASDFEDFLYNLKKSNPMCEDTIKFLYSHELVYLSANIQNLVNQVNISTHLFYEKFNQSNILDGKFTKLGLTTISGSYNAVSILTLLEAIIIKATSILDFISTLAYEVENLPVDFKSYPKRKSFKYSHSITTSYSKQKAKNINWNESERENTIFDEDKVEISILKELRNHIVHNGFLDMDASIYENRSLFGLKERFILIPDFNEGKLEKYMGRTLFYSQDTKLNLILPSLLEKLMELSYATLFKLVKKFYFGVVDDSINLSIPDLRPMHIRKNPL